MLSNRTRAKLTVVFALLITIHIFMLPPTSEVAATKKALKQVDALIEDQNYTGALNLIETNLKYRMGDSKDNLEPFLSRKKEVHKLNESAEAYHTAMTLYNKGDMVNALSYFRMVIPEDVSNFTAARTKISELNVDIVSNKVKERKASGGSQVR